jgi:PAS domain S-box-containing protein
MESRPSAAEDATLSAIVRSAPDAVISKTVDGVVTSWNAAAERLYGYSAQEMIGRGIEITFPAWRIEEERERHARVAAGTAESGYRCTRIRSDGQAIDVVMSMTPVYDAGGQLITIASISRPVTDAERAQARYASLLEAAPDATLCVDGSGRIVTVNAQTSNLFGYSRDELLGAEMEMLLPEDVHERHREHRASFTREPQLRSMGQGLSLTARRRDGSVFPVEVSLAPDTTDGDLVVIASVRDVTSRVQASEALRNAEAAARAAEAAARTANQAKNQFLSRMSHELRTPLNAVLGFGQLLQRRLADTEYAEAVRHIVKGGRHLLDLINDVLDIARIESGDMSISSESVAFDDVVAETIELMQPLAVDAGITMHRLVSDPQAHVMADRQRLRQILLNLLSNAIKYNHTGGDVWVGWEQQDGCVALTVRDNGQGIAHEHLERLFTPFDRLGAEASSVEGTGIGLALTRALAEMMKGRVTVESTVGEGSTFTLTLDAAAPTMAAAEANPAEIDIADGSAEHPRATLLYVEDNVPNVRVVEELLKLRPQWRLVHAATGSLGIELAVSQRPDLILLDLHLPDLSGRDVLAEIKRRKELSQVTVIVLSADAHVGLSRQLIMAGAGGYLTKPFDIDDVLAHLDSALEGKELRP